MGWKSISLVVFVMLVAACSPDPASQSSGGITLVAPDALPTSSITDPVVRQGQANYDRYCAHCHGFDGEGQMGESAEATRKLGMKTVPSHDETGVAWQYADQVLLRMTREGIVNGLNRYPMPGFGTTMTDDEIMGVYAYIKTWWTAEQRAYQEQITADLQATYDELGVTPAAPFPTVTVESLAASPAAPSATPIVESLEVTPVVPSPTAIADLLGGLPLFPTVTPRP